MRAARGERTERTPIWLMRQAGRSDPEYLRAREQAGLPLEELFRHPEWAAKISLLPRRIGVDAIIYFQDILTPLAPMGAPFLFRPGPVLAQPVRNRSDIEALQLYDVAPELPFITETFHRVRDELAGELPVLGFAGAPLTLLVFLVEGKSFNHRADHALEFMRSYPALAHALLDRLTRMTIDYLRLQIESGADAWQLFESAAHLLTRDLYAEFALPYQGQIFHALQGAALSILFARDLDDLHLMDAASADIISLPSTLTIHEARRELGDARVFQGNLDNHLLAEGPLPKIRAAAESCVRDGQHRGHIFNLSHGILKETPFEHVLELVRIVHETV